ncbi:MAG: phage holin family protein [Demequinaceae bacterium]|nr:phage holin family protein [Demequinaceae bacterium]
MRFLWRLAVTAFAIWVTTELALDVVVYGGNGSWWGRVLTFLGVALLLVLVNALVKPFVKIVTIPVRILTLGLFSLVINWAMLVLASWLSTKFDFATLDVGGFWKTLLAALVISVITAILGGSGKKKGPLP